MNFLQTALLALGLALDAVAVYVLTGAGMPAVSRWKLLLTALTFGAFQFFMPAAGFALGKVLRHILSGIVPLLAAAVLLFLGVRILFCPTKKSQTPETVKSVKFSDGIIILQAFLTSLDSMTAGFTFTGLSFVEALPHFALIGVITFAAAAAAIAAGRKFGHVSKRKIEIFGGVMLIAVALKLFFEQLTYYL